MKHKPIGLGAMIIAAERELGMRKRVYPKWVLGGRMSKAFADHELAAMAAIVDRLKADLQKEKVAAGLSVNGVEGELF